MAKAKLISILTFIAVSLISLHAQDVKEVTSDSVRKLLKTQKDWIVIDVRTPAEFSESHIPGAINIDLHQKDVFSRIDKLNKNSKYIVYCRTKNRSSTVTEYMSKNGFKTVYQMIDGIVGWNKNN